MHSLQATQPTTYSTAFLFTNTPVPWPASRSNHCDEGSEAARDLPPREDTLSRPPTTAQGTLIRVQSIAGAHRERPKTGSVWL